jgi:chromosome condensin MukBEF ATPase and DNA-binding subunit MukB
MEEQIQKDIKFQKDLEDQNIKYLRERNELAQELQIERQENLKFGKLEAQKFELETFIKELEVKINNQENETEILSLMKEKLEDEIGDLKTNVVKLTANLNKAESESVSKDLIIRKYQGFNFFTYVQVFSLSIY